MEGNFPSYLQSGGGGMVHLIDSCIAYIVADCDGFILNNLEVGIIDIVRIKMYQMTM